MQSIIWKLSALATVVGMGLTGVVYQQGGFGKPGGTPTAAVTAGGAPAPNVPGKKAPDGKSPPAEPAGDPFANAGALSESPADGATPQLEASAEGLPSEVGDTQLQTPADEMTAARTRPRTKTRARNSQFADEFANQAAPQGVAGEEFSTGAGNEELASAPPQPGVVGNVDPALMEGTPPGDQSSNTLTQDDPFGQSRPPQTATRTSPRGSPVRSPAGRARPTMNESDDGSLAQSPAAGQNAFGPGAEASIEERPGIAGKSRSKARNRLIEENEPPGAAAVAPAAAEVVEQIAQEPQYGPAASQFQSDNTPQPQVPAGKNRPRMDDEDAFTQGGAAPAMAPAVTSGRAAPGARTRPQGFPDDGTGIVEQPAAIPPDGAQPIPKLNRDATATDQEMPPAVAQGGRRRPNSLVEDGDEGPAAPQPGFPTPPSGEPAPVETGTRGREPEPEITDSAIPAPTQRRPSKYVLEVEPTDPAGGPVNQRPPSEAAASRTPSTQVIAVPKRLASNSGMPGTQGVNGGRPRVTIEKRAPATAYIGQPLIYQILIRNVGNGAAQQVLVEDIVPEGVAMQGSIPQAELVAKKLSWKIGSLAAGEERKISVKVIPGAEGAIGSAATVTFAADPALYASTAEPDPVVPAPPVAAPPGGQAPPVGGVPLTNGGPAVNRDNGGVTLDVQGPKQVGVGQPFDVRFRLTNRTNQPVMGVMIRKTLPDSLQHQTRIQDLEYRVGTLGPAESRDVTMTLTAVQPGRAVSRVMVLGVDGRVLQSQEFAVDAEAIGNQTNSANQPVTQDRAGNTRSPMNRITASAAK